MEKELAEHIIRRAALDMRAHPDWVHTFWDSRDELLSFFHSRWYSTLCDMLGLDGWVLRAKMSVPQPSTSCTCEWCASDEYYQALVQEFPDIGGEYRPGWHHAILWKDPMDIMGQRRPKAIVPIQKRPTKGDRHE